MILGLLFAMMVASCGWLQKPSESHLSMMGSDVTQISLKEAMHGTVHYLFYYSADGDENAWIAYCGGTYIDYGVIITAKHCFENKTLIKLTMYFAIADPDALNVYSAPSSKWRFISHPDQDLGLILFDPQDHHGPLPLIAELFELPAGQDRHQTFHAGVVFQGIGGHWSEERQGFYDTFQYDNLYILSQDGHFMDTLRYYIYSNLHIKVKLRFINRSVMGLLGCGRPPARDYPTKFSRWCEWILNDNELTTHDPYLIVGSTMTHYKGLETLKEVLFCLGDSGGGLRLADGRLIGIQVAILRSNYGVGAAGDYLRFHPDSMEGFSCSSVSLFLDIVSYLPWIRATIIKNGVKG